MSEPITSSADQGTAEGPNQNVVVHAQEANGLSHLGELIGTEAVEKLAKHFPGAWYYLALDCYKGPLPGLLARIDRLIGRELTLAFAREFGGQRIYFPGRADRPNGRIQRVIGVEATAKLVEHIASNETVQIPLGPTDFVAMRTQRIRSLLIQGWSTSVIARACGVTERGVWKNKRLLAEFNVIPPLGQSTTYIPQAGQIRLMLLEGKYPTDIATYLGVSTRAVNIQLSEMKRAWSPEAARRWDAKQLPSPEEG